MSQRAGFHLFCVFLGAMIGFYAAVIIEMFRFSLEEWPTTSMFFGAFFGGLIFHGLFYNYNFKEEPLIEEDWGKMALPLYLYDPAYNRATDTVINRVYESNELFELVKERQYMLRTGQLRLPPGKNHGDAFKELMEGSDPLDT